MLSKLTLIGMNSYSEGAIWDNIELPEGINKEVLINTILKECGEFSVLYPDLDFLNLQIQMFFKKWYHNFERWIKAYNKEYEALYNVDVHTLHDENDFTKDKDLKMQQRRADSATTSSNEHLKAAFDAATLQNVDGDSGSGSLSSSESSSESSSYEHSNSMHFEEYKYGNQGITMSQEMLLAEYNVWLFNIYSHIAEIFANELCVCIYQ